METIVIADASCLILLEKIGELEILKKLFSSISITPEVQEEYGNALPFWIKVEFVKNETQKQALNLMLDKGEASAIALCIEMSGNLIIIDEKKGRKIAQSMGLATIGTLGLLLHAKNQGLIPIISPILDKIQKTDFRISPQLIATIVKQAGE